jgi:hypothetical protein
MPYLTQDIVGSASRFCYGKKGDEVRIYSNHQNVLIVENESGIRFGVLEIQISNDKIEPDIIIPVVTKKKRK